MIIAQPKELIGAFVNVKQEFPPQTSWGENFNALGLIRGGRLVAGVIYNGFGGINADIHIGAEEGSRWMTPQFLHAAFDYPFNQLSRKRVTAKIHSNRKKAVSFVENLGFEYEGRMKHYYEDGDLLLYVLFKEKCRFLEKPLKRKAA